MRLLSSLSSVLAALCAAIFAHSLHHPRLMVAALFFCVVNFYGLMDRVSQRQRRRLVEQRWNADAQRERMLFNRARNREMERLMFEAQRGAKG